jgi:hypothetical protein
MELVDLPISTPEEKWKNFLPEILAIRSEVFPNAVAIEYICAVPVAKQEYWALVSMRVCLN